MKRFITVLALGLALLPAAAQEPGFSRADRFMHNKAHLLLGTTAVDPIYNSRSETFWYKFTAGDTTRYYYVDPETKTQVGLCDEERFLEELSKYQDRKLAAYRSFRPEIVAQDRKYEKFLVKHDGREYTFDRISGQIEEKDGGQPGRTPGAHGHQYQLYTMSPDSTYGVVLENFDLHLLDTRDSSMTRLTTDGERRYAYAGNDFMGIRFDEQPYKEAARVTWMSDSRRFYVLREDARKIGTLPLVDPYSDRPTVKAIDYLMAGDEFVTQYEIWIFDADTHSAVKADTDKWPDQTVKIIHPGFNDPRQVSDMIFFTRENRQRNEMELCRVDPETGSVSVVIREKGEPFLADEHFSVTILDPDNIIWWSERTGNAHYYRYNADGKLLNAITSGPWNAGKLIEVDAAKRLIYFEAFGQVPGEFPYFSRMTKARLDGRGKPEILTPEAATHKTVFYASKKYFVDNYSAADVEPRSVLRDNSGKVVMELNHADLTRLYATGWRMPERIKVMAADGSTELFGYMYKPFDFDSAKKYPIISYVYPGPQTEQMPLEFSVSGQYSTALAQVGFIVITIGHRGGSPMRDREYHSYGYGNLRDYPLADDKYAIEQLGARYPFIDTDRVGIFGHSGGGMMSAAAILTYPDFYKAAVSASGNHDNNIYFKQFVELYHGVEETVVQEKQRVRNPVTGRDTTVLVDKIRFRLKVPTTQELAANLRGHLMLVTGDMDNNVHPAHTMRLARALVNAGKNFDLVILPGERHVYTGANRDYFERKVWFHFAKHLLGDYTSETYYNINGYNNGE